MGSVPWLLLLWGVFVGLDLTTFPQMMIARPIVAGSVAGWLLGDPRAGLMVGAVLELFALDVLPIGASRYPDYGLGAVAGAAAVATTPPWFGLGVATLVGLLTAYGGGLGIRLMRIANTHDAATRSAELDEGRFGVVLGFQARGIARDAIRSLVVSAGGIWLGFLAKSMLDLSVRAALIATLVAIGAALSASAGAAVNVAGRRAGVRMYVVGLAVGSVWVLLL